MAALLVVALGCATTDSESDRAEVEQSLVERPGQPTDAQLRLQMMRFASHYGHEMQVAIDEAQQRTPELVYKRGLQAIRVDVGSALVEIATGPDAEINLLDMLVHVTLTRMSLQDSWGPEIVGPNAAGLVEVAQLGEQQVWDIGRTVLSAEQERDLRGLIDHWRGQHPDRRGLLSARFTRLSSEFVADKQLLAIQLIDDVRDATAEAREVRLTAERTRFMISHMPSLVQAQLQLGLYDFMLDIDIQSLLGGYAKVTEAAERLSLTAQALPAELERQRREALGEFWVGVAGEREALLASLVESEDPLTSILGELRRTIEVSNQLAERADRENRKNRLRSSRDVR